MKLRHLFFAAALAVTATQAKADGGFSDNSIGLRYGASFKEPGIASKSQPQGEDIHKIILNFGHFDVWNYGSNFINVDALFSDGRDPANGSTDQGAVEIYAVYRGQLSPDKVFGLNTKIGPFDAINLELGGDFNTKNTTFASEKKLLVFGPNFHIHVPAGFLTLGVHISKEWNYNGYAKQATNFYATPELEAVWLFPLSFTSLPMDFRGFANVVFPKGNGGVGQTQAVKSSLGRKFSSMSASWSSASRICRTYSFAVEYWLNKFGNDHTKLPGSYAVTPMIGIEVHF